MASTLCRSCGTQLPESTDGELCPRCSATLAVKSPAAISADALSQSAIPTVRELEKVLDVPNIQIIGQIGKGGMGVVYKARQRHLDRMVALKVLPPSQDRDISFEERFMREARALAKLSHPNIVTVHDFGRANEYCYFVMEYVDGVNLRQAIRERRLSIQQALALISPICDALQFAHDEGIVHRDIKPENILLDVRGRVKIADFGLARLRGGDNPHEWTITGSGQVMGTLHYMAPEQIEQPLHVDHRADIYALGVVLYELLTGELPIGRFAVPSQKVKLDSRLDDVVMRALEKEPARRFQHASDIKLEIERITSSVSAPPPPLPTRTVATTPKPGPSSLSRIPTGPMSTPEPDEPSPAISMWVARIRSGAYAMMIVGGALFVASIQWGEVTILLAPVIGLVTGGLGSLFVNQRCYRQFGRSGTQTRREPYTKLDKIIRIYRNVGYVLGGIGLMLVFATPVPLVVGLVIAAQGWLFALIRGHYRRLTCRRTMAAAQH